MKDSNVVTAKKLLNLSELTIEPVEICWNKVKMTSSRWITCCHRKLKKASALQAGLNGSIRYGHQKDVFNSNELQSYSNTICRTVNGVERLPHPHPHHQHQNQSSKYRNSESRSPIDSKRYEHHLQSHHRPQHSHPHATNEHFISSSYQTNDLPSSYRHFPNGFSSSMSSSSQFTPSSASPVSGSSMYDRKSSASSSASSNHSTTSYSTTTKDRGANSRNNTNTTNNNNFVNNSSLMRHSKSTIDLGGLRGGGGGSNGGAIANGHSPYNENYSHSLSRVHKEAPALSIENTITIINPRDGALISCQTDEDSNCAQISPQINVIAVSNEYWIAFYSIATNDRLGVLELPRSCTYWTWIGADTVAVVSRGEVLHWTLPNTDVESNCIRAYDRKRLVFEVDAEVATNQIINYTVDPLFGNWCALSTLFLDENGEVAGKVQVFSHVYKQSQCIDAHSCAFTAYQFDDSEQCSTLLIAARREKDARWKLFIHELGPIPDGNLTHRPISHVLQEHKFGSKKTAASERASVNDIPTHIACDNALGLVYLLSKYGSFYICDIETGVPLYYNTFNDLTCGSALFTFSYDQSSSSLLSVSRTGLVLSFQVSLDALIEANQNGKVAPKVLERIQNKIRANSKLIEQFDPTTTTDSNYSSSPTTSELSNSLRPMRFHYGVDDANDDEPLFGKDSFVVNPLAGGGRRPQPIYIESDSSEEVTRL